MKRLFTMLAALSLVLVLPGCKKSEEKSETAQAPAAAKKLKIGISIPAADHGWAAGVGWWAKKKMSEYPDVEWVLATANEPGKQTSDIEDMMAQQVDGLVVLATESAPITPVAEKAKARGIFIVNVDRGFLKPVADVFLEGDNKAFGRKSAEFIVQKLGGKGNVVILRGIPSTVDTDRYEAAMEVFKQNPGIQVLAAQPGMWNQQKSLEVMQSYLSQFPKIDAVWASDDDMALGAEKAIKEAGRQNEMWLFGGGGMKDIVKRVMDKDPLYPADITYPPAMIAASIDLAVANLRDGNEKAIADKIPAHLRIDKSQLQEKRAAGQTQRLLKLDVHLITPENAKEFYFPDSVY
ncbi:substrate-binding domain-containing protein [Archangium minus]|uniref:Substrate-binding domain-containing protein n=1 Tax=Archangium minus TaxID=83450 RepID=A0ABY9X9I9_9BACT|nr:substrate-binding domain-containing protein [Archangium minus]